MTIIQRGLANDRWESHTEAHPMTGGITYKDPAIDRTRRTQKSHPIRNRTDGIMHTHMQKLELCFVMEDTQCYKHEISVLCEHLLYGQEVGSVFSESAATLFIQSIIPM